MTRRSFTEIVSAVALAAAAFTLSPLAGYGEEISPGSPRAGSWARNEIFRCVEVNGRPMVRFRTGEEYPVLPLTPEEKQRAAREAAETVNGDAPLGRKLGRGVSASATPDIVDHRRFHGPIRDQGGRDTCGAFATTAAVEGFYRRIDPDRYRDLDLSEQWAHHVYKMAELDVHPTEAAYRETEMGCWGDARVRYELLALQLYGLPTEGALGYNPDGALERIGDRNDPQMLQWTADNYNLDANHLPLSALTSAPYRPTGMKLMLTDELRAPGQVEAVLAGGYDVVALIHVVSPMSLNADGAWVAGPNAQVSFSHIALIVGYNRPGRYFIVRNSWGSRDTADGEYTRISYDYMTQHGRYGCYVTGVADPDAEGSQGRQYLGRWTIEQWGGVLDIYRLPGFYSLMPGEANAVDFRIGTYYEDGQAWRVNGYWLGGDLVFCIDFANPNAPREALAGNWYVASVSLLQDHTLSGLALRDGWVEAFRGARQTRTF